MWLWWCSICQLFIIRAMFCVHITKYEVPSFTHSKILNSGHDSGHVLFWILDVEFL